MPGIEYILPSKITLLFEMPKLRAYVTENLAGMRLDQALAKLFSDYSRARFQRWIKAGAVAVDGKHYRARDPIHTGQQICVDVQEPVTQTHKSQKIVFPILYSDPSLIIINKPAGLVVHPGAGNAEGTLLNALLHHAPEVSKLPRVGIVHRLDKDTSGIMVVARTLKAHTSLVRQIQARAVKRDYFAIANGQIIAGGTIEAPIGRHPRFRTRMAVVQTGKMALTHYRVAKRFKAHSAVNIQLETGRTHQIRVHFAHIKHPLLGDPVYTRMRLPLKCSPALQAALREFKRQALHAIRLRFVHPETQKPVQWEAPMPSDMQALYNLLAQEC